MRKIDVCPSTLKSGFDTYSPEARRRLFDGKPISHILPFDSPGHDDSEGVEYAAHVGRISLSGVQPKGGLVVGDDNQLTRPAEGQRSRYILKPAPSSYALLAREFCPANEHFTMQLASQVYGIETAANALCFFRDGEAAYLTRRFDVAYDGRKYQQEDFASLAGLTKANGGRDFKYSNLSYEECAGIIRQYVTAAQIDVLRFLQVVLFNYITLNDDAHLKNFTLVSKDGKEYRLAPAYDLINTSLHLHQPRIFALDKGLFKEGMSFSDVRTVCRRDFKEFGRRIGLPDRIVERELDRFAENNLAADNLLNRSFLPDDLKDHYRASMGYRRSTLER
jgi:serine/threonine-protein kinase HipA